MSHRPLKDVDTSSLTADWPTLKVLTDRYIAAAVERTHGSKTRAADILGIDRRTIERRAKRARRAAEKAEKTKPAGPTTEATTDAL